MDGTISEVREGLKGPQYERLPMRGFKGGPNTDLMARRGRVLPSGCLNS